MIILSVTFASAEINATKEKKVTDSAYLWLVSQMDGKWNTSSVNDNSLAMLALSYDDRMATAGKSALLAKSKNSECWPSSACNVKSTALALLALSQIGEDTTKISDWLIAKQASYSSTGVTWLLQADVSGNANCTIRYDSKNTYNLVLNTNKTYSWIGSAAPCLTITNNNYWIEISRICLEKSFDIQCSKSGVSVSMPYRLGSTLYVSSETSNAPATMAIKTVCLKEASACNYDSNLWAAYALNKAGKEYSFLLPYLVDQSSANKKYMSDAFLYIFTSKQQHAENLLQEQSKDGYWTDIGGYGKFYDTAIATSAINDYASDNATLAKDWLLNQNKDGSWGTSKVADTSLILSLIWPIARGTTINDCQSVYGFSCRTSCLSSEVQATYSCSTGICCKPSGANVNCKSLSDCTRAECDNEIVTDDTGKSGKCEYPKETMCKDNFDNDGNGQKDLNDENCKLTCENKNGKICERTEECSATTIRSFDSDDCCVGTCIPAEKTCIEQNGVQCTASQNCKDNAWMSASDSSYCCSTKCSSGSSILIFIIVFIILILAAAAFYSYKKGFFNKFASIKKKPSSPPPSHSEEYKPAVRPLVQSEPQHFERKGIRRETSSEFDEAMKKLKNLAEK